MEAKAKEQEALLSQASGKAALKHVIAAVELYMKAVKEASSPAERTRLRKKCDELMARGERLKAADTPVDESAAVQAAAPNAATSAEAPSSTPPLTNRPISDRELPKKEQIILLKASRLHGSVFPPWEAEPTDDLFKLPSSGNALYVDDTAFSMSLTQSQIFAGWKRPGDLLMETLLDQDLAEEPRPADRFMLAKQDPDLVQDITTDCSVVASLCAMIKHTDSRDGRPSLLAAMMNPFDYAKGQPRISENGRYIFRMHFNGTFRKVVVDDRLPSSTSRTLFVVDRHNPLLIWPALLEKAYLKVHGGYDFPGSNSGTDLWVLTGWIPEQVFIQSNEADLGQTWERVKEAFGRGDVMVTLGTGRLSAQEETLLGLAGDHDYAVLDLQTDSSGIRRMLVKNPWCDNLVWRGMGLSSAITTAASPTTGTFWIGFDDVVQYYESLYLNWNPSLFQYRQDHHFNWTLPSKAMAHSFACNPQYAMHAHADGMVWILLNRHFQDAELDIARKRRRSVSAFFNGQGKVEPADAAISESTPSSTSQVGFISLYIYSAAGKRVQLSDQPRWLHRGPLVDSPQTLVRFEARKGMTYTIVVAQSMLPLPSYSFTLSFYSPTQLQVAPAADMLTHQQEVSDAWSVATAGGSAASPDFVRNPQYALTLSAATPLTLLLCADADDVPVRVDLVWARGRRVASLAMRDLVVSSGEYQRGCALAAVTPRAPSYVSASASMPTPTPGSISSGNGSGSAGFGSGIVDAGTYTVVVSTFERGQHTRYTLRVGSAVPVGLKPIPAEDAGKFRTPLEPIMLAFDSSELGGGGSDGADEGELRRQVVLEARLNTRISLVVQAVERRARGVYTATAAAAAAASTTAVRVSVERMGTSSTGPSSEVIATTGSGQFRDMTVAGLRTDEVTLGRASAYQGREVAAPWFRIVVEVRNGRPLANVGIQVDILSSDRVQAHPWAGI